MKNNKRGILIIGGGKGGEALLDLFSKCDFIKIIAVIDVDDNAPGIIKAKERGIVTGKDFGNFIHNEELDTVFNVTGLDFVQKQLLRSKPSHVEIVGGDSAKILWDLIESQKGLMEQLENKTSFIQNILDSVSRPFYVIDIETYEVVLMNKEGRKKASGAGGNKCYRLSHGLDRPCIGEHRCPIDTIRKTGKPVSMEHIHPDENGNPRNVQVYAYPIFDKEGKNTQMIEYSIDVTDMKKTEIELKKNREEFRTLINNVPGAIYRCTLDPDRSMKLLTEEIKKITGYEASDFLGNFVRSFNRIIDSEDIDWVNSVIKKNISMKKPYEIEYRIRGYNGEVVWVSDRGKGVYDKDGNLLFIDGAIFDITERVKIKKELKKSEERLETIVSHVLVGIVTIEKDTHIIVDVNPMAARMIGLDREDIIGKTCFQFICPAEEGNCPITDLGQEIDGTERILINGKGEEIPVLKTAVEVSIKGKKYILDSFIDITERKKAEEAIKKSEGRYRMLADNISDMIWTMDLGMNFKYISPSSKKLLGYDPEEMKIKNIDHLVEIESVKMIKQVLQDELVLEQKGDSDPKRERVFELQHIKKDGSLVWVEIRTTFLRDDTGVPTGLIGITHDISDRKEKDIELKKIALEWERTFESITDMISILDKDLRIIRVNGAFAAAVGLKPEEMVGKYCYSFVHGTDRPCADCAFQKMMDTGKTESVEFFEPNLGIHLEVSVSPVLDEKNNIIGAVHIAKDISKRKTAEKALLDSVKIKSDFTSMVSHELRTPLTAIKEGIGIVWDGSVGKINDEQKDFLGAAKRNVDRLSRLINEVLDFTKISSGKMKLCRGMHDIRDVIQEVLNVQMPLVADKGLYLRKKIAPGIPLINMDPDKILQVMNNLVNNAVKFTEKGGIEITASVEGDDVLVAVNDTGIGIDKEALESVFKEFHQVEDVKTRKVGGTGLGLSICRKILERHGGKIWAESVPGKGSSFKFILPVHRKYEVLVVDDDIAFLDLVRDLLAKHGYEIECVENGKKAFQKIREKHPDIIVLDMRLKDMNGYEVIGRLRAEKDLAAIPILAVSGYNDALEELDKLKKTEEGFTISRMTKPFDNKEFLKKIKEMLD